MRKALAHLKKSDPVMRAIIERVGPYAIQHREPNFTTLARSIISQQVSGKVARIIADRVTQAATGDGASLDPERVLALEIAQLRALGLSNAKAEYIRGIAAATMEGRLDFGSLASLPDEEIIDKLVVLRGVGRWTVEMFLIFALRRPDVLPVDDYGVRAAVRNEYALAELPKAKQLREIGAPWRPFSSVATWYLWRTLDGPAQFRDL